MSVVLAVAVAQHHHILDPDAVPVSFSQDQ